jgi:hypothetical protein
MWTPGIASWSRTIVHCLCKMLLIPQSSCSKVSRMACRDCGVCYPSLWVTVQFSARNEGSSLCRSLQILEVAKCYTVYLFLPVPVISDYSEEDSFLLPFSSYLQNLAWTIMQTFTACSVNHVCVQAVARFFWCAVDFPVCFTYAILILVRSVISWLVLRWQHATYESSCIMLGALLVVGFRLLMQLSCLFHKGVETSWSALNGLRLSLSQVRSNCLPCYSFELFLLLRYSWRLNLRKVRSSCTGFYWCVWTCSCYSMNFVWHFTTTLQEHGLWPGILYDFCLSFIL